MRLQQLCKSCRTCFKLYCMFYFTCDRSLRKWTHDQLGNIYAQLTCRLDSVVDAELYNVSASFDVERVPTIIVQRLTSDKTLQPTATRPTQQRRSQYGKYHKRPRTHVSRLASRRRAVKSRLGERPDGEKNTNATLIAPGTSERSSSWHAGPF